MAGTDCSVTLDARCYLLDSIPNLIGTYSVPKKTTRKSAKSESASSCSSRRRHASRSENPLGFQQLEDRRLLAAVTVTNTTDLINADTSSIAALIADDGGDGISLREAITAANAAPEADTITFDGSVFTGGASSLIRLTQGELQISNTLTIDGAMATDVTITGDANGDDITVPGTYITDVSASFDGVASDLLDDNSRVINVSEGYLTLSNLTITGGRGIYFGSSGGGIFASGDGLELIGSEISGNSTVDSFSSGGGIHVGAGTLSLTDSTVSGNRTTGRNSEGGGISFFGSELSLVNSIVSGNSTSGDGSGGGGIYALERSLSLVDSEITGNSTSGDDSSGGGVSLSGDPFVATESVLINSTISENITTGRNSNGGGIYVESIDLTLNNSLVNGNSAAGYASVGGGISAAGITRLISSEVSRNSSYGAGGGIYSQDRFFGSDGSALYATDSVVSENSTSGREAEGGGIFGHRIGIARSTISGNSTSGLFSNGGGVYIATLGSFEAFDSTVSENFTEGQASGGGGIHGRSVQVSLTYSTLSGNNTRAQSSDGGGISALGSNVVLTSSTVSGNSAAGTGTSTASNSDGGGVIAGTVVLTNSTVSGNSATGEGGGVLASRVFSTNSTITDNSAGSSGGGIAFDSGGFVEFRLVNSIVAGNTDDGTAPDIRQSSSPDVEHSLIGDTTGSDITPLTGSGNILDQPALLGPLADNGGPTKTHAPLAGSLTIDAGSIALAVDDDNDPFTTNDDPLTTDQRGENFVRISGVSVDIGAFEVQPLAPIPPTVLSVTINEGGVLARPDLWNTLTVVFDSEVTVVATDLSLYNDSVFSSPVDLSGIGFSFDSSSNTATWDFSTLSVPLDAGFYSYELDANSINFQDISLDGDGDGIAGGDFIDQHYVAIPGDANLDGVVDVLNDAFALVANLNSTTDLAWADGNFNSDGVVNVLGDAFVLVGNLGRNVQILSDLVVTNSNDLVNGDTGSILGLLADDGGDGISLREAITATNNTVGENSIAFDGSVFTGGAASLIRLTQGQLEITDTLTINAFAGNNVTISGDANADDSTVAGTFITDVAGSAGVAFDNRLNDNSRVFLATDTNLTLANLTVTGGRTSSLGPTNSTAEGGGIYATGGSLSLIRTTISGNSTDGGNADGGGISAEGAVVTLTDSTVSGNGTVGTRSDGGGLYARGGVLSLIRSTVSDNSTDGMFSGGGGISVEDGQLSITSSTVTGNSTLGSASAGGAIFTRSGASVLITDSSINENRVTGDGSNGGGLSVNGPLTLINSTISGNSITSFSGADGGGIRAGDSENILIINSTVTANSTNRVGGGLHLANDPVNGPTIVNSIIAGNTDLGIAPDLSSPGDVNNSLVLEHSLIGETAGSGITVSTGTGNILNRPALLGPLADNGGATLTHAPLVDSPVVNAGNNALAVDASGNPLTSDQRGSVFERIQVGTVDIGAFESTFDSSLPPTVVSASINEGGVLARPDLLNTVTIVFDQDVSIAPTSLTLFNDSPRGIPVDITGVEFSYDSSSSTATWDFTSLAPFDAGNYTILLDPNSVTVGNITLDGDGDGIGGDGLVIEHYVAIPGDTNLDGTVDVLNDGFALVANLNSTTNVAWANGDFNGDGVVSVLGDAFVLVANLGRNVDPITEVVVNNASDIVNGDTTSLFDLLTNDGGDGISLREAIDASNNTAGARTITFDEGVFSGGANSVIRLTQGELEITETLAIDASTASNVTITGDADGDDILLTDTFITDVTASSDGPAGDLLDDNSRVFNVSFANLTLSGLTVTGGRATTDGGGVQAGNGNLSLINSSVSGNSTTGSGATGGGINVFNGEATLYGSSVSGNSTDGSFSNGGGINVTNGDVHLFSSTVNENTITGFSADGGGISVSNGEATLYGSSVTGNSTGGSSSDGGGINVIGGDVHLFSSTVNENTTTGTNSDGGGIHTGNGTVSLINSTISGNSTTADSADGGGISAESISLANSTITENSAGGVGGGIGSLSETLTVINSIIAGNTDDGTAPDLFVDGAVTQLVAEHSLIGDTTGSGITASTGVGNILDQPALLGPLADNGGPTLTHALLVGSPAINAGSNALAVDADGSALTTDQRGIGFDRINFGQVDIGAFESDFNGSTMPLSASSSSFAFSVSNSLVIGDLADAEERDDTNVLATTSQSPSLVLAGDHQLRDDVFGSDF